MNLKRRKRIDTLLTQLAAIQVELEEISQEEQDYLDNMPENLMESEKYSTAEENCENLTSALDSLGEVVDYLESSKG